MRVSLAPRRSEGVPASPRAEILAPEGARVVLGGQPGLDGLAAPIAPAADTLFGCRGACLATPDGPLLACDTGHHRLLLWRTPPARDGTPADLVLGQPAFDREGRNARGEVGAATLNVPTGVAAGAGVIAVADAWNHRVLIWHGVPERSGAPADLVLGQADFTGGLANRGADRPSGATLNWCYGVAILDGRLVVADTGNRRVLVWDSIPTANGAPADLVLGQRDFVTRDENAGTAVGPVGMRWPHGLAMAAGALLVADAGNNRVMVWRELPRRDGAACDLVLGQATTADCDHNRGCYFPTATAMSMPYGLAVLRDRLVVADTANSRLLGFDHPALSTGAAATGLVGQADFGAKGDNRWGFPTRGSLCWPYGVAACGATLVVADSGNNRILLWDAAP